MRDHPIKPSTELRLLSHGLSADIYALDDPKSPRIAADSVFVGEDIQAPDFIDKGESIKTAKEDSNRSRVEYNFA